METRFACAVVTGASAGLGEEFVRQLSARTERMVLVARRTDRLELLAAEISRQDPQFTCMLIGADLSDADARLRVKSQVDAAGWIPDLLVNNAGMGDYGEFVTADWAVLDRMLRVNIDALTHLTHLFSPEMMKRKRGWILNVSSLASTLAIPDFGVYAATKAYVSSFTEALRIELMGHGVHVTASCPGPVKTEFGDLARRAGSVSEMPSARTLFYVSKTRVVAESLRGLLAGRARVFPGRRIALIGFILGAMPVWLMRLIMRSRPRR